MTHIQLLTNTYVVYTIMILSYRNQTCIRIVIKHKRERGEAFYNEKPHVMDNRKLYDGTQGKIRYLSALTYLSFATLTWNADQDQG